MATWQLDPNVTHLNHGSFGATPVEVLQVQQDFRDRLEANPVSFMLRDYQPALDVAREALGSFVGGDPAGLVFVPNATYGVNSVLRSLERTLPAGAEILITNHTYNACANAAVDTAKRISGSVVVADIPFPIADPQQAVDAITAAVTAKTTLVMLDHVTSATGLVLPLAEIIAALPPEMLVLVDGAHAPGMLDVDIESLGVAFYTANCHKWICSPKGAAFLWAREDQRDGLQAVAVSHGYNDGWPGSSSRFHAQFDWTGTTDPTAWLSVPAALQTVGAHHPDGWAGVRSSNHELVLAGREIVASALDVQAPAPASMIGSIAALRVPPLTEASPSIFDPLTDKLHTEWAIEVPVFAWPESPQRLLRISAQQYNTLDDYEHLAKALTHCHL